MKILQVNDFEVLGGAEVHVQTLRKGLERRGHQVDFSNDAGHIRAVAGDYDIVHLHNLAHVGIDLLVFLQEHGVPYILSLHDYWPFCNTRMMLHAGRACRECNRQCGEELDRYIFEAVSHARVRVTFSSLAARIFDHAGLPVRTIPHGLDLESFPVPPPRGERAGAPRVVFINAVETAYWKGESYFDSLLFNLDGQVEGVKIGGVGYNEAMRLMAQGDIMTHVGYYDETFCLTVVEAMALGLPVASFDVGGVLDTVIDGETGFIVPQHDLVALRQAVEVLARDVTLRRRMGEAGREHAWRLYNLERMAGDYERLYQEVL